MTASLTATRELGLIGTYIGGTDAAATDHIYAGEGRRVGRRHADPRYQAALSEALRLYESVLAGSRRAALQFQEAMSRSDFQLLFGDVLDRQLLGTYNTLPVNWQAVARRGRVRDFRTVRRFTLDGGKAVLQPVAELAPYQSRAVIDGGYEYSVGKYGAEISISWESVINDDLDAFRELPQSLALAARRTEERFATSLYATPSGPNSSFFSAANKNVVQGDPPLSISGLQAALTVMGNQVDSDGAPIYVEAAVLVVPPALEVTARNILNATEILAATGGGDGNGNDQLRTANWMRNHVQLVVNPWLPIVDQATGNTAWYVFAAPSAGRPAMEVGFLIGHESPELWMRTPDAVRVGGGTVAPEEGDFEHDAIRYRVRHVLGGTLMDPKMGVASKGTGTGS